MMTMRLFAEEKNRGTIELLLTSPIKDWELVIGKWLGSLIMFLVHRRYLVPQYRDAVRLR